MDPNQIDAASAILIALGASMGAGASEAVKNTTREAVTSGKVKLLELIRGRLHSNPLADARLTVYAADPTPEHAEALRGHIVEAGLDQDEKIVTLARKTLEHVDPQAIGPGSVAAAIINQKNTGSGNSYIGGNHTYYSFPNPS